MKAGVPWSVKGIEPETRAAAKAAARRAGMTLGEWLSQKIREPGEAELASGLRRSLEAFDSFGRSDMRQAADARESTHAPSYDWAEGPGTLPDVSVLLARLDRIESQHGDAIFQVESAISTLAHRIQVGQSIRPGEGAPALEKRVAKLELDGALRQTRLDASLDGLAQRADTLDDKLGKIDRDGRAAAQTFEQAFGSVSKRLGAIEQRQREHAHLLEQAVVRLGEGLADALQREDTGQIGTVRTLEHAVEEITRHYEALETRREATQKLVESALSALADRIADADRRQAQSTTTPIEAIDRAVERMQSRLQDSERRTSDALAAFDSRLRDVSERLHSGDTEFRASRAAIALALGDAQQKIDGLAEARATDPAPEALSLDPEPRSLAELASEIMAHDQQRVSAPEAFGPETFEASLDAELTRQDVPPADDIGDAEASADETPIEPYSGPSQDHPFEEELTEDVKALLGAARLIARAEDPAMASATAEEPADVEPVESVDAPSGDDDTLLAAPASGERSVRALLGAPSVGSHDPRAAASARGKPRLAVMLGLIAGAAVGGLILVNYGDGSGRLSATRPGLAPSLADAVRRFTDEAKGALDRVVTPKHSAPAPSPLPGGATALPPAGSRQVPVSPPTADADAPHTATSEDVRAFAADAIKALKAAQTPQEEAAAAKHVGRAAALGDADAQFALGRLYETGRSIAHDPETARRWYTEAASHGNAEASFNLGMMDIARGGDGAYDRAARYFRDAAERGNVDAQVNLALLYEQGLGVPRDDAQALSWYSKAALRGDPEATRARDRLAKRLGAGAR